MATHGRPVLRDLFDESPTPHIAHPPHSHHRDYYVATDGSFRERGGGLGVVIEAYDGSRVTRLSVPDSPPDNNVAEYRALHLGLDVLAEHVPADATVGILVDHDQLAENVNSMTLAINRPDYEFTHSVTVPQTTENHWRGIQARIAGFDNIRAARIRSDHNPAHPLANRPDQYGHVNRELPQRSTNPETENTPEGVPPPSRSKRPPASD